MARGAIFQGLFLLMITLSIFASTGCSLWSKKEKSEDKKAVVINGTPAVKFSEVSQMPSTANRQYKHMTRGRMEEESELNSQAGSMWVMEGQGAYLFTQNKSRREGDSLNIKIEGAAQKQIETKVSVIKKLLQQLEDDEKKAKEIQTAEQRLASNASDQSARAPAAAAPVKPEEKKEKEKEEEIKVDMVPTRITEKMVDGNYRVKGQQPFMIGKREYKVIVTGIIRPEDYNDDGVGSNKILDPQYDVVSLRKKEL